MGLVAGAAVGAAGGIVGGILKGNAAKKAAKSALEDQQREREYSEATREKYSQMIQAEQGLAADQLRASEAAALNVWGSLGAPGTYDQPTQYGGPFSSIQPTGLKGLNTSDSKLFTNVTKSGAVTGQDVSMKGRPQYQGTQEWSISGKITDPDQMAAAIKDTSSFRTVSKMVAEAEQMMNRSGPLWNEMNNALVGSVYQSSAAGQRDMLNAVSSMIARKGGGARTGMDFVARMQVQRQINADRTKQLWDSKIGMENLRQNIVSQRMSFAQEWTKNTFGIRDTFTNQLVSNRTFWSSTWPAPAAQMTSTESMKMQDLIAKKRDIDIKAAQDKIGAIVNSSTGLVNSLMGMGGGGGMGGMMGGMGGGAGGGGMTAGGYTGATQLAGGGASPGFMY